jgi:hypothetical protein
MSDTPDTLETETIDAAPAAPAPAGDAPAVPPYPLGDFLRQSAEAAGETPPCLESLLNDMLSNYQRIYALPGGSDLLGRLFGGVSFGRTSPDPAAVRLVGVDVLAAINSRAADFGLITGMDMLAILAAIAAVRAEEACRAQPVRWLGDHGRGSLGVADHDYLPGDTIDNPDHLAALGAVRVAQLVSSGQAELVPAEEA